LAADGFVLDVQPLFAPSLDGVGELNIKTTYVGSDADANAAYVIDDAARVVPSEIEDTFPQAPMRMGPEETFAEGDEDRNMEDGIWVQLMQLDPIKEK
jgi:hypothetical protein